MNRERSTEINLENWGPSTTVKRERGAKLRGNNGKDREDTENIYEENRLAKRQQGTSSGDLPEGRRGVSRAAFP